MTWTFVIRSTLLSHVLKPSSADYQAIKTSFKDLSLDLDFSPTTYFNPIYLCWTCPWTPWAAPASTNFIQIIPVFH